MIKMDFRHFSNMISNFIFVLKRTLEALAKHFLPLLIYSFIQVLWRQNGVDLYPSTTTNLPQPPTTNRPTLPTTTSIFSFPLCKLGMDNH